MLGDVARDHGDQLVDAAEGLPPDALVGDLPEPTLDQIQPGTAGGNEVHVEARMFGQPLLHFDVLVGVIVVHDQMQVQLGGSLGVDEL